MSRDAFAHHGRRSSCDVGPRRPDVADERLEVIHHQRGVGRRQGCDRQQIIQRHVDELHGWLRCGFWWLQPPQRREGVERRIHDRRYQVVCRSESWANAIGVEEGPVLEVRVGVARQHHEREAPHVLSKILLTTERKDDGSDAPVVAPSELPILPRVPLLRRDVEDLREVLLVNPPITLPVEAPDDQDVLVCVEVRRDVLDLGRTNHAMLGTSSPHRSAQSSIASSLSTRR